MPQTEEEKRKIAFQRSWSDRHGGKADKNSRGNLGSRDKDQEYRELVIAGKKRTERALFDQKMRDMLLGDLDEPLFWESHLDPHPDDWQDYAVEADEKYATVMTRTGSHPQRVNEQLDGTFDRSVPENGRLITLRNRVQHNRTGVTNLVVDA